MKTLVRTLLAVAVLASTTAVMSHAINLVQNPGFESGSFTPGWTQFGDTANNGVCMAGTCPDGETPFAGTFSAFFGPVGDTGGIFQNITTVPGDSYLVSFWLALPTGGTPNSFSATFGSGGLVLTDFPGTFQWALFEFSGTATSTTTPLTFTFREDPSWWFLDNVSVAPGSLTTPEPGTLVLFGSGLIGIAGVVRRKFRV